MNYDDALAYMTGRLRLGEKYGNARFETLLKKLGSPHEQLRAVHVAGTKGKGSTVALAASVLQKAGGKVGAYFSPYVYDVRERVQINGTPIGKDDFARWVTIIQPHMEALDATELGPTTEFELKTAVGFCWLAEQNVDYAVVEVGLGGRLDATNVLSRPLVSVITTIGLDHTEILGHTLGEIAGEKAGIVKCGVPCVTGVEPGGEAWQVIVRVCKERHSELVAVAPPQIAADGTLTLTTPKRQLAGVTLTLRGAFQQGNAAAAAAALDAAGIDVSDDAMRAGLAATWLPGRMEVAHANPTVILDGAHNEMAAHALADALGNEFDAARRKLILIVGMKRNHEADTFLAPLAALKPAALIATQPSFRPLDAADIAAAARRQAILDVWVTANAPDALRAALSLAGPDDLIVVTGSFYTVGDLPPAVRNSIFAERN